jgi:hypothetical protein
MKSGYDQAIMRAGVLAIIIAGLVAVGCHSIPAPPSHVELAEERRLAANAERATELLESGVIHPGQGMVEAIGLCTPYRIDFADRYMFVQFFPAPGLYGLTLVAVDGRLALAIKWSCNSSERYFDTMNEGEERAAWEVYERRLFGEVR